jgi:hypothetical protein
MRLFDTETATELCGVKNDWGNEVEKMYVTKNKTLFTASARGKITVNAQKEMEKYLGEHHPDIYERIFGKVKEG